MYMFFGLAWFIIKHRAIKFCKLPSLCSEPLPRRTQNTVYRLTILHLYQLAVSVNELYGCNLNGRVIVLADAGNAVLPPAQPVPGGLIGGKVVMA